MTLTVTRDMYLGFVELATARDNLPYGYGGAFSMTDPRRSTDCSGLVMSGGAYFMGMNWGRRYGSTESFRKHDQVCYDLGFLPGPGGPEHFYKAGFMHGGGGENSHTACTVNGVNWESSGSYGVQYGPPARGWNDKLFARYEPWHLDAVLEQGLIESLTPAELKLCLAAAIQVGQPQVAR